MGKGERDKHFSGPGGLTSSVEELSGYPAGACSPLARRVFITASYRFGAPPSSAPKPPGLPAALRIQPGVQTVQRSTASLSANLGSPVPRCVTLSN